MSSYIDTTVSDGVAVVTIDRAERHNSLVPELLEKLLDAVTTLQDRSDVRVLLLQTAGDSFSTGGDVAAFYAHRDDIASYADRTVGLLNDVILVLVRGSQPVVTAVDGQVTGGSIGLLLASDIVLLADTAEITPYYSVVGYSPDGGWTAILPAIIGRKRTARILMTNETITPEQAVRWGLGSELVGTDEDVRERAVRSARELTEMKQGTLERTKRLLGSDPDAVAQSLDRERREFVSQIQTDEAREGMRAFLD